MAKTGEPKGLLEEFEEAGGFDNPWSKGCSVCASPHREEIDAILRRGATGAGLARFLKAKGVIAVAEETLRRHRRNCL